MRIGIIDLGTNSVRFDIHQFADREAGRGLLPEVLHREKIMVRLGEGVFLHGRLNSAAISRTLHAFVRFKEVGDRFQVQKMLAFGTSALREAQDRENFRRLVAEKTGIDLRVISGAEEAKLIALGVLSNEPSQRGRIALIDIGGGSTEISICRGQTILHAMSFPLGTARLQQVFLKKSPPDPDAIVDLRIHIRSVLAQTLDRENWGKANLMIGSSGTVRAISRILQGKVEPRKLATLIRAIQGMKLDELLAVRGLEPRRADMILGGAILLEECMVALGARQAITTGFSLRDGMLEEERRRVKRGATSHLSLHLDDLFARARAFGCDPRHSQRTAKLAGAVFDGLSSVHGLKPAWRVYLVAAAILRDVGEAVSPANSAEHSYYIVKHSDLPTVERWEIDLVAWLCRLHDAPRGEAKPAAGSAAHKLGKVGKEAKDTKDAKDTRRLPFEKGDPRRRAFRRLLAMLLIVDALDTGARTEITLASVQTRGEVRIRYRGRRLTGLEGLKLELHKPWIKKALGRAVRIERAT